MNRQQGIDTLVVHAGAEPEESTGAVMTPIYQSTTFAQESPGKYKAYEYSRSGNPTRDAYETALAAIEGGEYALAFASGLAASQAIIQLLEPGDHILVSDDVYGGTGRLFRRLFARYGLEFEFIDMSDPALLESAYRENTRLVWIETPTNPMLKIVDIAAAVALAKRKNGGIVVVDNTFATPVFQRPLELGADLVIHSTTKYIGGHSDFIGGAIALSDSELYEKLKFIQFAAGSVPSPFECFLGHRSIKTLALRMRQHDRNALAVAEFLQTHPKVEKVSYPGLPSSPQYELAQRQMQGFSGIVTFQMKGNYDDVLKMLSRLQIFILAESLGGVESLINHPEQMTHASVPPELREELGIGPNLLRLSMGIEDAEDLIRDLDQALSG